MHKIGDKVRLDSDKGVFTITSTIKQKSETMYEVTNGDTTFWTNETNFKNSHSCEQLCLFDFADEIASQKPAIEEKTVRVYKEGDKFSNGSITIEIANNQWGRTELLRATANGYMMEGNFLMCYNIEKSSFDEITDDTIIRMGALGFSFSRLEDGEYHSLQGDGWNRIEWLHDPKIAALVEEAYKDEWHGDDRISVEYDLRDLFVMKWMGLERLPKKNLERTMISTYNRKMKPTYYDVEIKLGELLRFMKMKEVQA